VKTQIQKPENQVPVTEPKVNSRDQNPRTKKEKRTSKRERSLKKNPKEESQKRDEKEEDPKIESNVSDTNLKTAPKPKPQPKKCTASKQKISMLMSQKLLVNLDDTHKVYSFKYSSEVK